MLLDCGYGTFASYREHASERPLDAIALSHAHRDHADDLGTFLSVASAWRKRPRVIASSATIASLELNERDVELTVVEDGDRVDFVTFSVELSTTTHQIPTLAMQVTMGAARVVYGADTGPDWRVPSNFLRADLSILECTIEVRDATASLFHLDAREVANLAQRLDARVTLVTHVPPRANGKARLERAKEAAPEREFLLAASGLRLVV